jgi:hypothetical protein
MSDTESDYGSDDDFATNLNNKSNTDIHSVINSDSEMDSETDSETDSESESETENNYEPNKIDNFKVLLEQQFPKNIYNEQELLRYRTINYLIWKKGNGIICDIHSHFDATYSHNKICVKLLLEAFCQENKLKEYILNKQDKQDKKYIKIDDLIKFFIDEIHNEKSKYCCNKKNNTIGMYCIYMPIIYYILGITIKYNKDYRPNIDNIDDQLWKKIEPKRSEWDILNAIQNYLMHHDLFSKYLDDLRFNYQYNLHGKKYDLAIGNYIGIEYNEKSKEHKNNSNDINKELILNVSGFTSLQFYEIKLDENLAYIKIFFANLENKLSEQLITNNYNFEQEYNFKQFFKLCQEEVNSLNNEIKDIENSDIKDKKNLINGKIKALKKWQMLLEDNKTNQMFKKLYDYKINGDVAEKENPQNEYAQYNIPLKFVIHKLFRSTNIEVKKNLKNLSCEYIKLINSEFYFSWYSLAELINSMNDKSLYELKTMNFKLLMKIEKLVKNTSDIKLQNEKNITKKFQSDYSEIINEIQKNYDSKLESQKKVHENTVSKLTSEIKALQILNKSYDQIIYDIDKIKNLTLHTFNCANYCYKYTIIGVDNLKQTIKSMKTNTDEFNKNYDNFIIESEELINTMNYYLNDPRERITLASSLMKLQAGEPLGENDNNNINEFQTQIDKLKNGKLQNITHKNMCNILTKLNNYVLNIKKDIKSTYDIKTTNKNIKEINKLFLTLELVSQKEKQIDINNYQLNLNEVGNPIILGTKDSFPIILTDDIEDFMPFTYVEGIFKAYNIPSILIHTFYKKKASRDLENKNGTMIPYIKMIS